jgi:hypothetical protein
MELLRRGSRLHKPAGCPGEVYNLMLRTWNLEPEKRPAWKDLVEETHRLFTGSIPARQKDRVPCRW